MVKMVKFYVMSILHLKKKRVLKWSPILQVLCRCWFLFLSPVAEAKVQSVPMLLTQGNPLTSPPRP